MQFKDALNQTHSRYAGELRQILDFCKRTDATLTRRQKRKPKVELSTTDKKDLKRLAKFMEEIFEPGSKRDRSMTFRSGAVGKLLMHFAIPLKHKGFLYEMALSYLVVHQESLLKDYLYAILTHRREILKSEGQLSYADALSVSSIKNLARLLAQKEVDKMGYGGADDADLYFQKRLGIQLSSFADWDAVVEASLRRNIFVHNKGIVNDQYIRRTGSSKKGARLKIDLDYIEGAGNCLIRFNDYCRDTIANKLKVA